MKKAAAGHGNADSVDTKASAVARFSSDPKEWHARLQATNRKKTPRSLQSNKSELSSSRLMRQDAHDIIVRQHVDCATTCLLCLLLLAVSSNTAFSGKFHFKGHDQDDVRKGLRAFRVSSLRDTT
jgi:hypothetical protein